MTKTVAVLSGGQDSSTALSWAVESDHLTPVSAVHFQYGQRHSIEEECARWWANRYDLPLAQYPITSLEALGHSALTDPDYGVNDPHPAVKDLPATFVPGRNLVFFTLAAAYAMKVGATAILSGVCQRDYSGYPDCREETLLPLQRTIQRGMEFPEFEIVTPLLNRTKAETWALAERCGVVGDIIEHTHTCYEGDRTIHQWGYGCGECPACEIRREGFEEWQQQ